MEDLLEQFDRIVIFDTETTGIEFGRDEIIEIKHTALSREIFATGAVRAAIFLAAHRTPGRYNMSNLIQEEVTL